MGPYLGPESTAVSGPEGSARTNESACLYVWVLSTEKMGAPS